MSKCNNCPLKNSLVECPAISLPHPRYCELTNPDHPDYNEKYVKQLSQQDTIKVEPSLIKQAFDYAVTKTKDAVYNIGITQETISNRLSICNECEFLILESRRCSQCGCPVDSKVRSPSTSCPVSKWKNV